MHAWSIIEGLGVGSDCILMACMKLSLSVHFDLLLAFCLSNFFLSRTCLIDTIFRGLVRPGPSSAYCCGLLSILFWGNVFKLCLCTYIHTCLGLRQEQISLI